MPPIIVSPRINTTQQVNYERKVITFAGAQGPQMIGSICIGSVITNVALAVAVGFNAGTSNPITLGITPTGNELMAAADNTPGTPGYYQATRGLGAALTVNPVPATAIGDPEGGISLYANYQPTGTAPTAGSAILIVTFVPPTDT